MNPFTAQMIAADTEREGAPRLRREFALDGGHGSVVRAKIRATALGVLEVSVNGRPVSEDLLTPGWSSYEWRLRYAEWDVAPLLAETNVIGVLLGHGWYSGYLGFGGSREVYGTERAALLELTIAFSDGHVQTIATDSSWQSGPSEVLADDLYNGETIDARLRDDSWTAPGAELAGWSGVRVVDFDRSVLTPYVGPPVREQQTVPPRSVWTSPAGATLIDFGQNLVGWIRLRARGEAGQSITLRHAEVLEHDELGTRPLRGAKATDMFVLSGRDDVFEPTLTFHGFRYAEITGWTGTQNELADAIEAVVIGSDLRRIGTFETSEPLLNQLHSNIVWGMRGNFVDVPTDCPQRDERLGWTGDLAAFIETAAYLYDIDAFSRDWLLDLGAEQEHADGMIPVVIPDNLKYENVEGLAAALGAAGGVPLIALWNDAAAWVPWALWEAYGDLAVLEQQYDSIAAYARRIAAARSADGVMQGIQLGDWLDPTAPPENPFAAKADGFVVATACVYRSAVIATRAAEVLGHTADAAEFADLASRLRAAFNDRYVADGRITSDATAVYSLAIAFDLLDPEDRAAAGDRLAELVAEGDYRVTTGFAGTPFISRALTDTGHLDAAYRLILQRELPSWLYAVTMGATTIWERWDSMLPDGSINPGEMTSFNHYAFGAIGDWMHRVIGGLSALEPGYTKILIAPQPGGGLTWAKVGLDTPHGHASVEWRIVDGELIVDAVIPHGATGVIRLPGSAETTVGSGEHRFTVDAAPADGAVSISAV